MCSDAPRIENGEKLAHPEAEKPLTCQEFVHVPGENTIMTGTQASTVVRQLRALVAADDVSRLLDSQLLERFLQRREEEEVNVGKVKVKDRK